MRPSIRTAWISCALLLSAASQAASAETLTVSAVLQKHAQALGGLTHLRAMKRVHSEATLNVGGLKGRAISYSEWPGRLRADVDLTIAKITSVVNGDEAWELDPNGHVKVLEGTEKKMLVTELCFGFSSYLDAPDSLVHVSISHEPQDSAQYVTLAVEPRGGEKFKIALDPSTWLPAKYITLLPTGTAESYLSDYRDVGGVKVAFHNVQVLNGDAAHGITSQIEKFEQVGSLPDSLWLRPGAGARDWSLPAEGAQATTPIRIHDRHIFLKAGINGKGPFEFILDTGAGATTLDKGHSEALGLKAEGKLAAQGVGGTTDFGFTKVESFEVGEAVVRGQRAVVIDLKPIAVAMGEDVAGILGYDFISRFAVTIDYAAGTLTLTDPDKWTPPAGASLVPIELIQNVPTVEAVYGADLKGRFLVDTGNNGSVLLHGPFVRAHDLVARAPRKIESGMMGAGGEEKQYVIRGDSLRLGDFTIVGPLVSLSQSEKGITGGNAEIAGNIGGELLQKFVVTFDYSHKRMCLVPGPNFSEPMNYDRIGWRLDARDGKLWVRGSVPGSPSAQAGIKKGDRVIRLGLLDVSSMDPGLVREKTRNLPNGDLSIQLERDGTTMTLHVQLEPGI